MNNSRNKCMYGKQREIDLQEMFKAYKENGISPIVPTCDVTFCDDFETRWFDSNNFISKYSDNFDVAWFDNNNYINTYEDEFENNWFTINNFINISNEDFEGEDWDE